jgi:carbamoyltransferase
LAAGPETLQRIAEFGPEPQVRMLPGEALNREAARLLAEGRIVGVFRGRAEFGPRALGNRSILADPRDPGMKDRINQRVKFREEFRPFAPAILHEHGDEYFENYQDSPYMERTLRFRENVKARVPAVVHDDGTGRLQSVTEERNAGLAALLREFHQLTDIPLLLNTSLNIMGKPIVHSAEDALGLLFSTGLDVLIIEDLLITKEAGAPGMG